jgi:hypothetical protein
MECKVGDVVETRLGGGYYIVVSVSSDGDHVSVVDVNGRVSRIANDGPLLISVTSRHVAFDMSETLRSERQEFVVATCRKIVDAIDDDPKQKLNDETVIKLAHDASFLISYSKS